MRGRGENQALADCLGLRGDRVYHFDNGVSHGLIENTQLEGRGNTLRTGDGLGVEIALFERFGVALGNRVEEHGFSAGFFPDHEDAVLLEVWGVGVTFVFFGVDHFLEAHGDALKRIPRLAFFTEKDRKESFDKLVGSIVEVEGELHRPGCDEEAREK